MATGDDALAAGMQIMTGNEQARTLGTEMNLTRDYIAQRTNAVTPVDKGGTGSTTPAAARNALGITLGNLGAASTADLAGKANANHTHAKTQVTGLQDDLNYLGTRAVMAEEAKNGTLNSGIYNRGTTGQWRSLAVQADGILAHTASARRFKENITPLEVTDEQLHLITLVSFTMKTSGVEDFGLIAEDLIDAGLGWAVFHDDDGTPLGIHYERVALAMLPVMQRLLTRVEKLEEGP